MRRRLHPHLIDLSLINECRQHVDRALGVLNTDTQHEPRQEMRLLTAQGTAALYEGNEDRASLARAIAIADQMGDEGYRLRARWALCHTWFNEGNFLAAEPVVREFWYLSAAASDPRAAISGDYCMGILLHVLDNQADALAHAERVLARPDVSISQRVLALGLSGAIYWHFGNQSKLRLEQSEQLALSNNHFLGLCNVLANWSCPLSLYRGDLDEAERGLDMLRHCAARSGLGYWLAWTNCFKGALLTQRGDLEAGPELMRTTFASFTTTNSARFTTPRTWYADCLMQAGRHNKALSVVEHTIERSISHGVLALLPENYRLKGEILERRGTEEALKEAARYFMKGLGLAYRSGALSWQLKLAMSLVRLGRKRNEGDSALGDLARIYACFSDRQVTMDLRVANAILEARLQGNERCIYSSRLTSPNSTSPHAALPSGYLCHPRRRTGRGRHGLRSVLLGFLAAAVCGGVAGGFTLVCLDKKGRKAAGARTGRRPEICVEAPQWLADACIAE